MMSSEALRAPVGSRKADAIGGFVLVRVSVSSG
jgi:hypothetical protein